MPKDYDPRVKDGTALEHQERSMAATKALEYLQDVRASSLLVGEILFLGELRISRNVNYFGWDDGQIDWLLKTAQGQGWDLNAWTANRRAFQNKQLTGKEVA